MYCLMENELTNEQRFYPTPPKDGFVTVYPDGTRLSGSWSARLDEWRKLNLHRIPKPEYIRSAVATTGYEDLLNA